MQRVFARDVLACPKCGGCMRVLAAIDQPRVIEAILRSLGLTPRAPPLVPAQPSTLPLFSDDEFPSEPDPAEDPPVFTD